jgi:mannosyltransferase PIG-V
VTAAAEDGPRAAVLPERDPSVRPAVAPHVDDSAAVVPKSNWLHAFGLRLIGYWKPLTMLAASRLVTFFVVFITRYVPGAGPVVGGLGGGHRFDRLAAWDGGWYIFAAQHGWPHAVPLSGGFPAFSTLAFFPAFPLSIRAVHAVGLGWIAAGFVTALLFQVVMVILLWQLVKEVWGETVADRGTMLFLFSPGALAFALIYSEPMLFAAAAACLLALRRRWWVVAGLSAAVGTAVRPVGVALIACCLWEAGRVIKANREWSSLIAPILSPLGIVGWMGYLWAHTGSPFTWSKAEKAWDDSFDPFTLIKRFFFHEVTHTGQRLPHYLPVAGALFCVVALVLLWKARPPATFIVYSIVVVIIAASSKIVGLRPRLVETAFPLVLVFGSWLKGTVYTIVLAASGVVLGGLLLLSLTSPRFIP